MILEVTVTERDIDEGVGGNCSCCPIALAVNRALKTAGLDRLEASWEPYRAFCTPDGLLINDRWWHDCHDLCQIQAGDCPYEMTEFAGMFDHWYERQTMDPDEEDYLDQDGLPYKRPAPFACTLDLFDVEREWAWS